MRAAIYIHIPFCMAKCAYCDFASYPGRERDMARYLCALEDEMRAAEVEFGRISVGSLYLGGGTPSLLSGDQMAGLLHSVRMHFDVEPSAEISAEANPGTVDAAKLDGFRRAGINRLSIGVQTFDESLLKSLGRIHTPGQAEDALRAARDAGFDNLSADLMYALPGQTEENLLRSVDRALSLQIRHLSLYCLTLEPGTKLFTRVERGEETTPDPDEAAGQQEAAEATLAKAGFSRYEISNYAIPGYECRHNLVYWRRGNYLGLGCAAHSMMNGVRFFNTSSLDAYLSGVRRVGSDVLSAAEAREEELMLRLRMAEGLDLDAFTREYGKNLQVGKADVIRRLTRGGLTRVEAGRLTLTSRGMNVQSAILMELL